MGIDHVVQGPGLSVPQSCLAHPRAQFRVIGNLRQREAERLGEAWPYDTPGGGPDKFRNTADGRCDHGKTERERLEHDQRLTFVITRYNQEVSRRDQREYVRNRWSKLHNVGQAQLGCQSPV